MTPIPPENMQLQRLHSTILVFTSQRIKTIQTVTSQYDRSFLRTALQQSIKKTKKLTVAKIYREAKAITSKLKLDDRIECFQTTGAFILF